MNTLKLYVGWPPRARNIFLYDDVLVTRMFDAGHVLLLDSAQGKALGARLKAKAALSNAFHDTDAVKVALEQTLRELEVHLSQLFLIDEADPTPACGPLECGANRASRDVARPEHTRIR